MSQCIEKELLKRARDGLLRLVDGVEVEYFHLCHKQWKRKIPDQHPLTGRYRFRFGPRRLTVYRNRLIWILTHLCEVPDGQVVDHVDGDPLNDHPSNLCLMDLVDSHQQGYNKTVEKTFRECMDFFEDLAF